MKSRLIFLVIIFGLIIFAIQGGISFAQDEGCFLYAESTVYCSDISQDLARQECISFDQCHLDKIFFKGESCKDIAHFPQCQEVLCKSSCDQKFMGQCEAGAIPPGDQEAWCGKGCCRLNYAGENHCSYKTSKWLCEVDARNKELKEFVFTNLLQEKECTDYCNQEIAVGGAQGVLVADTVSALPDLVLPEPKEPVVVLSKELVSENGTAALFVSKKDDTKNNNSLFLIVLGLIVFLLIVSVLFHYWHKQLRKGLENVPFLPPLEEKLLPWWMSPFHKSREIEVRLSKLEKAHVHKVKEGKRNEFFTEFGLVVENMEMDHFTKLRHLGAIYERRKHEAMLGLEREEKAALEKLGELVGKIESGSTKLTSRSSSISSVKNGARDSPQMVLKKDAEKVIEELRKMVKGK